MHIHSEEVTSPTTIKQPQVREWQTLKNHYQPKDEFHANFSSSISDSVSIYKESNSIYSFTVGWVTWGRGVGGACEKITPKVLADLI